MIIVMQMMMATIMTNLMMKPGDIIATAHTPEFRPALHTDFADLGDGDGDGNGDGDGDGDDGDQAKNSLTITLLNNTINFWHLAEMPTNSHV